jgi:nucleoside-diphosphate-sugar epimerase
MGEIHLITGATGFIGAALTLELLHQTDAQLVCLVRPNNRVSTVQSRLQKSLSTAAEAYGHEELLPEIERRCRALSGDILQPLCGEAAKALETVSEVWHCAASLQYEDENERAIFQHNVLGTKNVLNLAARLRALKFNYVSTAYVAGTRTGTIMEHLPSTDTVTNNPYEKSKVTAELLVAASRGLHTRILRPSIVIGHSRSRAATSFTGLYGFIRELSTFKRRVARRLGGYLSHRALRILADDQVSVNLVPVDVVASNAVRISRSNSTACIFHLTNDFQTAVGESLRMIFSELGLRSPRFVTSRLEFTSLDEVLDRQIRFYESYLCNAKVFDTTNTRSIVGPVASQWPLGREGLLPFIRWYLSLLAGQKQSLASCIQCPRGCPNTAVPPCRPTSLEVLLHPKENLHTSIGL